jgi:hypothetical protein
MCTMKLDQVNCSLPLDLYMAERQSELAPHKNILDVSKPRSFSNAASIPKPIVSTISEYIFRQGKVDPEKLIKMECLAEEVD